MGTLFAKKVWLSESSFADIKLLLFSTGYSSEASSPRCYLKARSVWESIFFLMDTGWFSVTPEVVLPEYVCALIFTVTLFILDDYSRYWTHRALHRIPILWEFHKYTTPLPR